MILVMENRLPIVVADELLAAFTVPMNSLAMHE